MIKINSKKNPQLQFKTAQYLLQSKPDQAFENCLSVLKNSNSILTSSEQENWATLKQQAETAIAEKRKTNPQYASHLIISQLPETSLTQRSIENPTTSPSTTPISRNNSPNPQSSSSTNIFQDPLWLKCQEHIKTDPDKALSLCSNKLSQLQNNKDSNDVSLQISTEENLWTLLLEHIQSIKTCFQMLKSNQNKQALTYTEKQITLINQRKASTLSSQLPNEINPPFETIYSNEQLYWQSLSKIIQTRIDQAPQMMYKFLNPKPLTGIDWDRFAKPTITNYLPYIDSIQFPELYKIGETYHPIESKIIWRTFYFASTTIVLTIATSIALYLDGFQSYPEGYIFIPISTAIFGTFATLFYSLMALTFASESIFLQLKNEFNKTYKQSI